MSIRPEELGPLFTRHFGDRRLVVVSNREPYEHRWSEEVGEMDVRRPAGGLTSALDPLMQALGGMWVAWGSGEADAAAVDSASRVRVPPESPAYTLRRAAGHALEDARDRADDVRRVARRRFSL